MEFFDCKDLISVISGYDSLFSDKLLLYVSGNVSDDEYSSKLNNIIRQQYKYPKCGLCGSRKHPTSCHICKLCFEKGHTIKQCKKNNVIQCFVEECGYCKHNPRKHFIHQHKCGLCGKKGHHSSICDGNEYNERFHGSYDCSFCGGSSHMSFECKNVNNPNKPCVYYEIP